MEAAAGRRIASVRLEGRAMRKARETGGRPERGLTYIELLVAAMVLLVLASAVIPLARWDHKRRGEKRLKVTLTMMRDAIDQYKKYADEGLIVQEDVEQMGYPPDLEALVEGVQIGDPQSTDVETIWQASRYARPRSAARNSLSVL